MHYKLFSISISKNKLDYKINNKANPLLYILHLNP